MTTAIATQPGLSESPGFQPIQATAATLLDGFVVRQDFSSTIQRYLRRETVMWQLIRKRPAEAEIVKDPREGQFPDAGFVDKIGLNPPENDTDQPSYLDLTDPGQEVKAMGGVIKFGHFARSLYDQQGRPYGETISDRTDKLMVRIARSLEEALFVGDVATNPLSFNGISKQMAIGHNFTADTNAGDSVITKLRRIVRLATSDVNILRKITHIWCSGLALEVIEEEIGNSVEYLHQSEVVPGLQVPSIMTQVGRIPIVATPYILDLAGGSSDTFDTVYYYLIDMDCMVWKGIYPQGGQQTFAPQIFDVSQYTNTATPYLLEKRMALMYGTLYVENRGEGIYKLAAKIPKGRVGQI